VGRHILTKLIVALLSAACWSQAVLAKDPLTLKQVIVRDPGINNVEALRFLAPSNWKVEGGILWRMDTWLLATLSMRLSDPASKASITIFPADTFTWSQGANFAVGGMPGRRYMGSVVMRLPDNTPDTVTHVLLPAFRPQLAQAKPVAIEDLPELAKVILQQNQEAGLQKSCQASRLRFEYNDADGTPVDEDIYAVIIRTPMPMINAVSWHLERCTSIRAEHGRLESLRPILTTMMTSAQFGPEWVSGYNYVVQLRNQGNMQAIANAGALSRHLAENAEEIRKMNRQSYEYAQRVHDETSTAFSQTIRGVENYNVPGETNTRVELPTGYNHAWYDASGGQYVLSDDPNFDPNKHSNHSWVQIERSPR